MTMEIKVDAEAVNKVVAEAIVKSALGQQLEESINKAMKETLHGYNSPIQKLVSEHVNSAIREVLQKDYRDKIVAMLSEKLSNEHVTKIVDASVDKALKLLAEDRY